MKFKDAVSEEINYCVHWDWAYQEVQWWSNWVFTHSWGYYYSYTQCSENFLDYIVTWNTMEFCKWCLTSPQNEVLKRQLTTNGPTSQIEKQVWYGKSWIKWNWTASNASTLTSTPCPLRPPRSTQPSSSTESSLVSKNSQQFFETALTMLWMNPENLAVNKANSRNHANSTMIQEWSRVLLRLWKWCM